MYNVAITSPGIRDIDAVMVGRLMFASGLPVSKDNAQLVGETAQKLAMYGEAQIAQQKGATLTLDAARSNGDKASMPEQIRLGATQNGIYNVKLAEALYGYGMYPQAEAAARAALAKGGVDASEAQMLIGMSLFQQGKLAESAQAFTEVKGGSAATPRIARLWGTFIKVKQSSAPAAPAQ
jgi:TolA-binding protein